MDGRPARCSVVSNPLKTAQGGAASRASNPTLFREQELHPTIRTVLVNLPSFNSLEFGSPCATFFLFLSSECSWQRDSGGGLRPVECGYKTAPRLSLWRAARL